VAVVRRLLLDARATRPICIRLARRPERRARTHRHGAPALFEVVAFQRGLEVNLFPGAV